MAPIAIGRGRIEIHHGPPAFFDDNFEKGWTGSGLTTDGELGTLSTADVEKAITSFSTTTYPKLYVRVASLSGSGSWFILLWYDAAWNIVLASDGYTGLKTATLTSGKTVTKIRILSDAGLTAKFDYISIVKSLVVPLDPPTTQDIWGAIVVTPRLNKNSSAEFVLNNIPSTFKGVGPYTGLVDNKDVVIIWMYREGESMTETKKQFGGIIIKLGDRAEKTAQYLLPIECMDHGWELQKPPTLFNSKYSTATNGKTILKVAIDLCSYLSSALVDDASEIASTHTCDYSAPGTEVVPLTLLTEFAPKCQTSGGAIGFDWRITPSGVVDLFPRNSISSGITLNDDDLESFTRETDWWLCWNDVIVYGAPLKRFPLVADTWTEGIVDHQVSSAAENSTNNTSYQQLCTLTYTPNTNKKLCLDLVAFQAKITAGTGYYRITYKLGTGTETVIVTDVSFTNTTYETKVHSALNIMAGLNQMVRIYFYVRVDDALNTGYGRNFLMEGDEFQADWRKNNDEIITVTATAGDFVSGSNSIRVDVVTADFTLCATELHFSPYMNAEEYPIFSFWIKRKGANFTGEGGVHLYDSSWNIVEKKFNCDVDEAWSNHDFNVGEKHYGEWSQIFGTSFDWRNIEYAIIYLRFDINGRTGAFCLDFANFGGKRYSGSATNSTSQTLWGVLKRPPETDDSLLPDSECVLKAQGILATCESPIISVGPLNLYEGQKVGVGETVVFACTTPSINLTLSIVEVELILEGTELESSYKLSSEPVEIDHLFKLAFDRIKLAERASAR